MIKTHKNLVLLQGRILRKTVKNENTIYLTLGTCPINPKKIIQPQQDMPHIICKGNIVKDILPYQINDFVMVECRYVSFVNRETRKTDQRLMAVAIKPPVNDGSQQMDDVFGIKLNSMKDLSYPIRNEVYMAGSFESVYVPVNKETKEPRTNILYLFLRIINENRTVSTVKITMYPGKGISAVDIEKDLRKHLYDKIYIKGRIQTIDKLFEGERKHYMDIICEAYEFSDEE